MKSLTQLQQEARTVVDKICFDPEVRLNAKLVLDSLTARVYAAALDSVESGMPKENTNIPETIGAGQTQEALSVGKDIGWNNCREAVLAHLRTLCEGITGNEKSL